MKTALLVDFYPRTRVVVDIPEGQTVEQYLENDENYDKLVKQARENMCEYIDEYLCGDNMMWDIDNECPYGTFKDD